jgi:hypothetical protein
MTYIVRTSPVGAEAMAGFVTATGVLRVMCFDGGSWINMGSTTIWANC